MYTLQDVNKLYDDYNKEYFEGSLPKVRIFFNGRIKRSMGYFDRMHNSLALSKRFLTNEFIPQALEDTLLHEMIHVWQVKVLGLNGDHRKTFHTMANTIRIMSNGAHNIKTLFNANNYYTKDATLSKYRYYRIKYNTRRVTIASVTKYQVKSFTKTQRFYRIPIDYDLPRFSNFRTWKAFLENKGTLVEKIGNKITKVPKDHLFNVYMG